VRIERVVLEDHGDVALLRGKVGDVAVADPDRAGSDLLETGHHPQHRRLPAARRPDQHEQLAVAYVEAEITRGDVAVRVGFVDVLQRNSSHTVLLKA
jgi:hypothetical protein